MKWAQLKKDTGFTIVELLIVIVVIGILAAITIVAYNGVTKRAAIASIQSDLASSVKTLEIARVSSTTDQYPLTSSAANLKPSSGTTFSYSYNAIANNYCLIATNGTSSYYVLANSTKAQAGSCGDISGLVGWWKFNGDATDSSGNNLNGTVNGPVLTAGWNGLTNGAYLFNGGTNAIALPASSILNLTTSFTLSAWVKLASNIGTSTWDDMFAGGTNDVGIGVNVDSSGNGQLSSTIVNYTDATAKGSIVTKNIWHHLVATYSSGNIVYYLDGNIDGTATLSSTPVSGLKQIGSRTSSPGALYGAMDDMRLYNRTLAAPEVQSLFMAGAM
jgi:prepilin-type N-terminal cleavage/methylation domain-containing protein